MASYQPVCSACRAQSSYIFFKACEGCRARRAKALEAWHKKAGMLPPLPASSVNRPCRKAGWGSYCDCSVCKPAVAGA